MAGFNFETMKNSFSRIGGSRSDDNRDKYLNDSNLYEEEDQDSYAYDDEYEDGGYDAEAYEDGYEDDYEEDDPDSYADGYADYDDEEGYEEEYENEYSDEEEYSDEYEDDGYPSYNDEDEDPETLGYNPAIFANLDDENTDGEYEDEYYDDEDGQDQYDDEYDEYYENGQESNEGGGKRFISFVTTNDYFMYASLILLPPLGVWLLWHKNKFDITMRTLLSAISTIWLIIVLILIFTGGSDDPTTPVTNPNFVNFSAQPTTSASPSLSTEPSQSPEPSTTPHTGGVSDPNTAPTNNANTGTVIGEATYVYTTNTAKEYHLVENCGGLTNASKITLETALTRGKVACATCAGGEGIGSATTVTYYATDRGTWYHKDSTCQGMLNASVVQEANAIAAGKTACPVCIGYYGTPGGTWYHSISNCSKMQNAITNTKAEWEKTGKTPCPVCLSSNGTASTNTGTADNTNNSNSDSTPTQTMVYATQGGKYFHTKKNCSGMAGASHITAQQAASAGKDPCPECVSQKTIYVFATTGGKYFHTRYNCSGMKNAQYVKASAAVSLGKTACPDCADMFKISGGSTANNNTGNNSTNPLIPNNTNKPANDDGVTYVYATSGGNYMHIDENCSGMKNAHKVTFSQAEEANKPICPNCFRLTNFNVYATAGGKYFHTVHNCSGMKDAVAVTAATAISYGKKACPTCAKALESTTNATMHNTTSTLLASAGTTVNHDYASASSTVYVKLGSGSGKYYHLAQKCTPQGISGASNVTLEYALKTGYTACPSCNPPRNIF
ncbi:MAG: hypothetical protein IJC48_03975 [Clostridia bacterium]|nr:hypothetical protein [Clostridia bacterium]